MERADGVLYARCQSHGAGLSETEGAKMRKKEMLELKRFMFRLTGTVILFISSIVLLALFYFSVYIMINRNFIGGFILMVLFGFSALVVGIKNFKFTAEIMEKLK